MLRKPTKKRAHPFLEQVKMTEPYSGLHCWETEIDLHRFPTLKDHAFIQGGAVMPGTAYVEMAFAMVKDKFVDVPCFELTDVKLLNLLTLPETQVINILCIKLKERVAFQFFFSQDINTTYDVPKLAKFSLCTFRFGTYDYVCKRRTKLTRLSSTLQAYKMTSPRSL